MTDKTHTPTSDAATLATTQPTAPVATEDTPMTEPKAAAPDPKVAAVETRTQPKLQNTDAPAAPDTEAVATRAREAERDRVSTIYDLAGRLNLERGFAEDLVKRGVSVDPDALRKRLGLSGSEEGTVVLTRVGDHGAAFLVAPF